MTLSLHTGFGRSRRAIMSSAFVTTVAFVLLFLFAPCAAAQEKAASKSDELDVTMQIIVDPDAKLSDEVVRRIPLPARKRPEQSGSDPAKHTKPDAATKGQERAADAQELGREMSERAKDRAQDAAEQREQARRSIAEDKRRRNPGPPSEPPRPPKTPPRH